MNQSPPAASRSEHSPIPRAALRVEEAAHSLGLSRTGFYRLVREGKIRVVKIGSRTVVPISSLEEILRLGVDEK